MNLKSCSLLFLEEEDNINSVVCSIECYSNPDDKEGRCFCDPDGKVPVRNLDIQVPGYDIVSEKIIFN